MRTAPQSIVQQHTAFIASKIPTGNRSLTLRAGPPSLWPYCHTGPQSITEWRSHTQHNTWRYLKYLHSSWYAFHSHTHTWRPMTLGRTCHMQGMYLLPQSPWPVFLYSHTSAAALDQDKERGHIILGKADGTSLSSYWRGHTAESHSDHGEGKWQSYSPDREVLKATGSQPPAAKGYVLWYSCTINKDFKGLSWGQAHEAKQCLLWNHSK